MNASTSTAVLCCADSGRAWEIRQGFADTGVSVERQYGSTSALIPALADLDPDSIDLLILDEGVTPMNVWDLCLEASVKLPSTAIILVLDSPDGTKLSKAMDVGARGVVGFPLSYEDVAARVTSALNWTKTVRTAVRSRSDEQLSADTRGGSMVTIGAAKGGTGASTIALHLARAAQAARPQAKVALVDLDLQKPDQSILLNVPLHRTVTDLLGVVDELTPRQLEDVLFTHEDGFSVLFGPRHGEEGELVGEREARQILGMLRSRYDVVIVDIGSVMGEANSTAVEMADEAFIVSTSDVPSLRGARRLSELWQRIGVRSTQATRIILNRCDRTDDIQPEAARKIVSLPVVDVHLPADQRALQLAANRRDPSLALPGWTKRIRELGVEMKVVPADSLDLPVEPKERKRKRRGKKVAAADQDLSLEGDAAGGPGESGGRGDARGVDGQGDESLGLPDDPASADAGETRGGTGRRALSRRAAAERGQSTLEFVGLIALFGLIAAIGFQTVLIGMTWVFAANAANEGARAAAVGDSARAAAVARTPAAWQDGLNVSEGISEVDVRMRTPLLVDISEDLQLVIPASAGIVKEP
ncbi:MAG: AAA family ATPase [Brevibacterium yomogidense]